MTVMLTTQEETYPLLLFIFSHDPARGRNVRSKVKRKNNVTEPRETITEAEVPIETTESPTSKT